MRFVILSLFASLAFAQTASYPGSVVTDNQLRVAQNSAQTSLGSSITSTDTSITLASGGFPVNSLITIDTEIMAVCGVSGNVVTIGKSSCPNVDGRGFDGTAAVSHSSSATVSLFIDAWYVNAPAAEIKAIETALGPNLSNVLNTNPQSANLIFAGPASGGISVPGFRQLVLADLPPIDVSGAINVMTKGATGNGTTPDDAAFAAAFVAACALPTGRTVYLPPPSVAYLLTTSYAIPCDFLSVTGTWQSLVHYAGTGGMWTSTIAHGDNLRISGLKIQGSGIANTYAFEMLGTAGIGIAKIIIDKNWITNFGDVAGHSGGGILIASDSAGAYIANNVLANNGNDIVFTAPSDTSDITDNFMAGSGWCVSVSGATGAATMRTEHNNMTCTKGGWTGNMNGGHAIISANEFETAGVSLTGIHGAVFDLSNGQYDVIGNFTNLHVSQGTYGIYAADDVIFSKIFQNHLINNATAGVRISAATTNDYHDNTTHGTGAVYSGDTLGIQHHGLTSGGAEGVFWGTETGIGPSPFHLVAPNAAYNGYPTGEFSISSAADHNTLLLMGYDNDCPTAIIGCGFLKAMKNGADSSPLWLSPPPLTTVNGAVTLVGGGLQEASVAAKPSCSASTRGMFFAEKGTTGVHDVPWFCAKTSTDTYQWVSIATVP